MHMAASVDSPGKHAHRTTVLTAPLVAWVVLLVAGIATAALVMREQDARGVATLALLTPVMSGTLRVGEVVIAHVWPLIVLVAGYMVFTSVWIHRSSHRSLSADDASVLAVVSLAFSSEIALLNGRILLGLSLLGTAALLAFRRRAVEGRTWPSDSFHTRDLAILGALTAVAAVLRLYELNRITDVFEGELSPYYLAATRLAGIPLGNAGVYGPWAPLGYLFYVPLHASIKIFGPTVLAIRFSSAVVGLGTLSLLYLFALAAYGRRTAVLAGVFYVLDPLQIGWGRTDVHPHGVTAWPAVLIALVCLRAFPAGGVRWFALLALLMALTWHQYPSGQTAVFIPLLVLGITLIRRERIPQLGAKVALLATGFAGWLAGPLLSRTPGATVDSLSEYLVQLGPRVERPVQDAPFVAALAQLLWHAATLTADVIAGLFVRLRDVFHQDIFVPVPELPSRSISWIVAALVLAGVCLMATRRMRPTADRILASWIAVAIVPAIVSDHAYPKRASMLFPALFLLAAATGARFSAVVDERGTWLRRTVRPLAALALALWFCATSWLWFSGLQWPAGRPNESLLVEGLRPHLTPGTIVIAKVWHGYAPGKLTYLLSQMLRDPSRAPLVWYVMTPDRNLQSLIDHPALAATYASRDAFYYRWPDIDPGGAGSSPASSWSRVVYVLQTGITNSDQLRLRGVGERDRLDQEWLEVLQRSCGPPQATIAPREDCDDCGFVVVACQVR